MFALATGARPLPAPEPEALLRLGTITADVMARAVMRAVHEAGTLAELPGYRDLRAGL